MKRRTEQGVRKTLPVHKKFAKNILQYMIRKSNDRQDDCGEKRCVREELYGGVNGNKEGELPRH